MSGLGGGLSRWAPHLNLLEEMERNVSTTLRQWRLNFKLGFTPFALVG